MKTLSPWAISHSHKDDPSTSLEASLEHAASGQAKTNRDAVLACLEAAAPYPLSSEMIADKIGLKYAEVSRRISDLGMSGEQLVCPSGSRTLNRSGKAATLWRLRTEPFDADHALRRRIAAKRARRNALDAEIKTLERNLSKPWS